MPDTTAPRGALFFTPVFTAAGTNLYGLGDVGGYARPSFVDIDGDGDLDALIGNVDGNTVVRLNTGSSTSPAFAVPTTNPYGLADAGFSVRPSFVDIDGDGDLDAFIGNRAGNTLVQLNTGSSTAPAFAAATTNPYGLADISVSNVDTASPSLVDIDGDDDLDAFIGNDAGNTLVYLNTGTASSPAFAAASTNPYGLGNVGNYANPSFVDIDGDGDLDALVSNSNGNTLVQLNTGSASSPAFGAATTNPYGLSDVGSWASPSVVDIDGDGDLDALIGNFNGDTLVFINSAGPVVPVTTTIANGTYAAGSTITLEVAFNENVIVGTTGGTPTLALETGAIDRFASYSSGSGTKILTFTYTVQAGDSSADLDFTSSSALALNGGTIQDTAGNNAILTLAAPGATGSLGANAALVIDGVAPQGALLPAPALAAPVTNPYGLADAGARAGLAQGDIDGDGDLDLLVGNFAGNLLVFTNTGSASAPAFASAQTNPYGLGAAGFGLRPELADLDGDGDLDILVGNSLGSLVVFINTGSSSAPAFAAGETNPYGLGTISNAADPTLGDIDGDGDLDLLVGNNLGDLRVFLNTGSSSSPAFATALVNPYGLSYTSSFINPELVDVDADGDLDVLLGNFAGNTLVVTNTGTATSPAFAAAVTNPYGLSDAGDTNTSILLDIDGDGDLDAFVGNYEGNTLVFINSASPVAPVTSTTANGRYGVSSVITLEIAFNENVIVNTTGGTPTLALSTGRNAVYSSGSGTSTLTFTYTVQAGDSSADLDYTSTSALALNGGTIQDAAGNNAVLTLAAPGATGSLGANANLVIDTVAPQGTLSVPAFAAAVTNAYGLSDVGFTPSPVLLDIDADGDLDALLGNNEGNTLVFLNTGTSSSPAFAAALVNPYGLTNVGGYAGLSPVDIDADGDLDFVIGNQLGNTLVFLNTGSASSPAFGAATTNPYGLADITGYASPWLVDIDADGDLDAFIGNSTGNILFFQNTGTASSPAFAALVTNPYGLTSLGSFATPRLYDLDGDGDLDALVGHQSGNLQLFLNTGTASSPAFAAPVTNPYGLTATHFYSNPSLADIDGDGDLDAFVGDLNGNTQVFINHATPAAPVTSTTANGTYATDSVITLQISFNENVIVNTTGGTPTLALSSGGNAVYTSGSGSNILTFTYTVQAGDSSADLDYASTSALALNGATIADAAGNNAILTLAAPGTAGSLAANANLVIDAVAPRGTLSVPAFAAAVTNAYGLSDVLFAASPTLVDIDADGDLDALLGNNAGNTLVFLNTGTSRSPAFATPVANLYGLADAGTYASLSFADIDADGDLDAFIGNFAGNTLVQLNTGSASSPAFGAATTNPYGLSDIGGYASPQLVDIDADGDLDAFIGNTEGNTLFYLNTGTASSPDFDARITNPYGLTDAGAYSSPSLIDLDDDGDLDALIGNQNGNMLLFLNTGTASSPAFAAPVINPHGLSQVGSYAKPGLADIDGDGDLDAFVGDLNGNTQVFINHATPVAPVTTTTANGTYAAGSVITLQIAFDENVIVGTTGGTPTLALETGTTDRFASYSSGSGTKILTFTYTVQATDTAADLDFISSSALALNGGIIQDAAGNNAILTLAAPSATGSLGANANLVITGTVDSTGNASDETMRGGTGNDSLDGAGGNDRLAGREGNDLLDGGEGDDKLFGEEGDDELLGGNGRDALNGGEGADTMTGGDGNDYYYVDDADDVVTETNTNPATGGTDTVYSYISSYTLTDNIENGTIKTSTAASLTGNGLNNILYGSDGNDSLDGAGGNDTVTGGDGADQLTGGAGRDILTGGADADTFIFNSGSGRDVIKDFNHADGDKISLQSNLNGSGITDAASALARVSDKWGSALLDLGDGHVIQFTGLVAADLTVADFMVF